MPDLELPHVKSGKVRDIHRIDADHLLLIASDRVSTYDVVHPTGAANGAGIAYMVSIIWEGAVDNEWFVPTLGLAREQAQAIVDAADPDDPLVIIVSEVYVSDEYIEATGYGHAEHFEP